MKNSNRAVIAVVASAFAAFAGAQQIQVQVDGNQVQFPYAQPQTLNDHVLVPLRGVFEQMGATVRWNQDTRTVRATSDQADIQLRIGDRQANVNGRMVSMEIPALILNGSTMVPIRFVSEALGAEVGWSQSDHLVMIRTLTGNSFPPVRRRRPGTGRWDNRGGVRNQPGQLRQAVAHQGEVIPVSLDQTLSSLNSRRGDTFSATVITGNDDHYGDFPRGMKVLGHVAAVHVRNGNRPALLDLSFDTLLLPNGSQYDFDGTLTSLDNKHVIRDERGHMVALTNRQAQDQRMVYAGYGAGAGLLVGVVGKRPIEGALLGGVLGFIVGQVEHDQQRPSDIELLAGTQMGVRIDKEITLGQ